MVVLRAGKGFCKDRQEGALVGEKGWLGLQAVETEVRGPDTTHDVSILPSEKPIRNGLTSSQLKYSPSCVCQVPGAVSGESETESERERGEGWGERTSGFNLPSEGGGLPSLLSVAWLSPPGLENQS